MKKCRRCQINFDCADRKEDSDLCFNCYEEKNGVSIDKRQKKEPNNTFTIFCDGSRRRNKKSGVGIVVKKEGKIIETKSKSIKNGTSNEAEYFAVIESLKIAKEMGIKNVLIRSDSSLVINQINKKWKVRKEHLQVLFDQAYELLKWFDFWEINHIRRGKNRLADSLAKRASS